MDSEPAVWQAVAPSAQSRSVTRALSARWFSVAVCALVAVLASVAAVALQNVLIDRYFPVLPRLTTDFSPAYVQRELRRLAGAPPQVVFLGDSVLWGYGINTQQTAVSLLTSQGCYCVDFGFKAGSPPNYYAIARLFQVYGVKPKYVVIEVNQKVLNSADSSYKTLHPAIAGLAAPLFSKHDADLIGARPHSDRSAVLSSLLSRYSSLYAMRSDIRETWFGDEVLPKTSTPASASADQLIGTYDLSPLDRHNVGVHFLIETLDALHAAGISVLAFTTPTNHKLMHDYIDGPEYRSNDAYLLRLIRAHSARTLDLDAAFPPGEFIDEDHLTPAGQRRLAAAIGAALHFQPQNAHRKD